MDRVSWNFRNVPLKLWKDKMDRFDAMSVLLAVVDAGSLSAGGRRLHGPPAPGRRQGDGRGKKLRGRPGPRNRRGGAWPG